MSQHRPRRNRLGPRAGRAGHGAGPQARRGRRRAAKAPAQPAPQTAVNAAPHKATVEQRAQAERLDPLARAAFWSNEAIIDPNDAEAGVKLASALRGLGRNDEAADAAQQVLVVHPDNKDALLEAARGYLASGAGFNAIDPLKRLQALDPRDWRSWSLLGVAYEQTERPGDAETAWNQALALSPDNPGVLATSPCTTRPRAIRPRAEGLLRKAAAQPGSTIQVRLNLALILGLEGKFAEAEQITRQDLPPEAANNNLAYMRAATGGGTDARSWDALRGAQTAAGS